MTLETAMTEDAVTWLVQEVKDLLDVSSVGLYEFIWLLRGEYPDLSMADYQRVAKDALRQLLVDDSGTLVFLTWPSQESSGDASRQSIPDEYWNDPKPEVSYVALARR